MKINEVIEALKSMKETYGNLDVIITTSKEGEPYSSEDLYFGYNQYDDKDKVDIRDFPY